MTKITFTVSKHDGDLISKIVQRAESLIIAHTGQRPDRMALSMDITAAHANGCPLDLERLLAADNFNFLHDVVGIENHIDRRTGKIGGHFSPRFAQREVAGA